MQNLIKDTSIKNKGLNQIFWESVLDRYRKAKTMRELLSRYGYRKIAEATGRKKQYIYGVAHLTIIPSNDFLDKIQQIGGEQ